MAKKQAKTKNKSKLVKKAAKRTDKVLLVERKSTKATPDLQSDMVPELVKEELVEVEVKAPPVQLSSVAQAMIDYFEKEILPRALKQQFYGEVPTMVDGKMVMRKVSNVTELEALISEMKKGLEAVPVTVPPPEPPVVSGSVPNLPVKEVLTESPTVVKQGLLHKVKRLFKKA